MKMGLHASVPIWNWQIALVFQLEVTPCIHMCMHRTKPDHAEIQVHIYIHKLLKIDRWKACAGVCVMKLYYILWGSLEGHTVLLRYDAACYTVVYNCGNNCGQYSPAYCFAHIIAMKTTTSVIRPMWKPNFEIIPPDSKVITPARRPREIKIQKWLWICKRMEVIHTSSNKNSTTEYMHEL